MKFFFALCAFIAITSITFAQQITLTNPEIIPIKLIKVSVPLRDLPETPPTADELNGPRVNHENESLELQHPIVNADALPLGADPALQTNYNSDNNGAQQINTTASVISSWAGLTAAVDPSDNTLAVGTNHVMQLTNNFKSTFIRVWNKAGTVLIANKKIKSISGINDYGDPQAMYDWVADRWLMCVLYSGSASKLEVLVSQTNDPTGSWYVYSFTTAGGFPDYPKISMWGNSYFITTNSNSPRVFALNRTAMLAGSALGTVQTWSMSSFPSIGFQSASPVMQTGTVAPAAGEPAMIMREADDAWGGSVGSDHLEIFSLHIDWANSANSTFTGPTNLNTAAFNSSLCGFGSGACIPMPGTNTKLDPLSDILMDKIQWRNVNGKEYIVCSSVCNATGNGVAGIRWYELKRVNNNWTIYQQGSYSPDNNYRFMPSITINGNGQIALGYNISSTTVYPGIRATGRDSCDALNMMTVAESNFKTGTSRNSNSRYGDYNGMVTDPTDGSFWFTGNYNTSTSWSTNVTHFSFSQCPGPKVLEGNVLVEALTLVPNPANTQVQVSFMSMTDKDLQLQVVDMAGKIVMERIQPVNLGLNTTTLDVSSLQNGYYIVQLPTETGALVQKLVIQK